MVGEKPGPIHGIVVLTPLQACRGKTVPDLHPLHRTDPHHCTGDLRIELPKDRVAKAGRDTGCRDPDDTPDRITRLFRLPDLLLHCTGIRHSVYFLHLRRDLDPGPGKELCCDRTGRDPADRLPA